MANINGWFQRGTVRDTRGSTDNFVGGVGNTVDFRGDNGANNFSVGGRMNNVEVHNLGKDDRVNLRGPGWSELPDSNARDGVLRYYNNLTGSYAEVHTDAGRNDNFVRNRVSGVNGSADCGCWNHLGMAQMYNRGFSDGYRAGQAHEGFGNNWFQASRSMGFNAWFNLNLNFG